MACLITTWNKQTSKILALKPIAVRSSEKQQRRRALYRFVFKLLWFLLLIRFRQQHCYYVAQKKGFFVLQICFETMPHEAKKRKPWSPSSPSTSALDSLVVEVSELRLFSSNFMRLALVVVCPSASSARLINQPFSLVTVWPTVAQSQRSCSTLNLWVLPDFCLFGFFKEESGQEVFLHFRPDKKKIWQERKLTCKETTRLRTVCVCAQIKYRTTICITCDKWR